VTLNESTVEIRNFIGERRTRTVELLGDIYLMYNSLLFVVEGVEYTRTENVKDQIEITGNDIKAVSLTAARIQVR